uniref:asparagine synthase (glutamine-hydrolyzing) n=1 Tax=viral metagenome TaxID=1070528 RepID=A0A6C0C0A8_9ZZZZ
MCGIFSLLNNDDYFPSDFILKQFNKGRKRGPEFSSLQKEIYDFILGFHRLAINGCDDISNQPIILNNDYYLICNGEIYNYKELYEKMGITPTTNSDCEVILHLYIHYGIEQTLRMLDGVFAFILVDLNVHSEKPIIHVARDPLGVRPLYKLYKEYNGKSLYGFASDAKSLIEFKKSNNDKNEQNKYFLRHFEPGTYQTFIYSSKILRRWVFKSQKRYFNFNFSSLCNVNHYTEKMIYQNIIFYLKNAVYKRCSNTERPVACLLSGGLDSSLICSLVCEYNKQHNKPPPETYSIGITGSQDLHYAKIVADFLHTKHTEIKISESDFVNEIPNVIKTVESYDTTTIRASIGNYLLGKYIRLNSEAKVILNGDGADELCGGYLYMFHAPDDIEYDNECVRLLKEIHMFDVLRSDKCISSHGLEPRTPFLDRSWVQFYMSIPINIRNHNNGKHMEKYLLRNAFSEQHYGSQLLPNEILFRSKEAFSDGVSKQNRSLFEIIQSSPEVKKFDYVQQNPLQEYHNPDTKEKQYYVHLFNTHLPDCGSLINHYWMPRFIEATDASARTLDTYKKNNNNV